MADRVPASRDLPQGEGNARHLAASALVARVRGGDASAFETLFQTYAPSLVRFAFALTGSRDVAEELIQDLFLWLWRSRAEWNVPANVEAYLYAAVRNRARNVARDARISERVRDALVRDLTGDGPPSTTEQTDERVMDRELALRVSQAIASLPPRAREVYVLNREYHMTYRAIADRLGVTVKAVEANMARAFRVLREVLEDWAP